MVQAATIMPVFLLALPGGAMADIVDRRVFLIGASLDDPGRRAAGNRSPIAARDDRLLAAGADLRDRHRHGADRPAWSAIVPELVPREDLVQAIALNGIGYNLTRAVGPALGRLPDPAGRFQPGLLAVCGLDRGGSSGAVHLAPWPPLHRSAAGAPAVRHARRACASSATRRRCSYAMVRTMAYSIPAVGPLGAAAAVVREDLGWGRACMA